MIHQQSIPKATMKTSHTLLLLCIFTLGLSSSWAQTNPCAQKFGADSVKAIQSISVYREFFKQKNYASAVESWMYVFDKAPCAREQTHIDGVIMYKAFLAENSSAARKEQLIDNPVKVGSDGRTIAQSYDLVSQQAHALVDRQYKLTNDDYGMGDFIEDLKENGYLQENPQNGDLRITGKSEQTIRKKSLEEIFGKLKKSKTGNHATRKPGQGDELDHPPRPPDEPIFDRIMLQR
ncbi:MAG: hypothetical protein EBS53_12105, partial [Bacteroidetes bacterium]|nr:hypothetical protein [Bacteroidota bacterium]